MISKNESVNALSVSFFMNPRNSNVFFIFHILPISYNKSRGNGNGSFYTTWSNFNNRIKELDNLDRSVRVKEKENENKIYDCWW